MRVLLGIVRVGAAALYAVLYEVSRFAISMLVATTCAFMLMVTAAFYLVPEDAYKANLTLPSGAQHVVVPDPPSASATSVFAPTHVAAVAAPSPTLAALSSRIADVVWETGRFVVALAWVFGFMVAGYRRVAGWNDAYDAVWRRVASEALAAGVVLS